MVAEEEHKQPTSSSERWQVSLPGGEQVEVFIESRLSLAERTDFFGALTNADEDEAGVVDSWAPVLPRLVQALSPSAAKLLPQVLELLSALLLVDLQRWLSKDFVFHAFAIAHLLGAADLLKAAKVWASKNWNALIVAMTEADAVADEASLRTAADQGLDELCSAKLLHAAAVADAAGAATILVAADNACEGTAPVDAIDDQGKTALHLCAVHDSAAVASVIIEASANIEALCDPPEEEDDAEGEFVCGPHVPAAEGAAKQEEQSRCPMGLSPPVKPPKPAGLRTPLHLAAMHDSVEVAQLLLDRHANVAACVKDVDSACTPLHEAAANDSARVARVLAVAAVAAADAFDEQQRQQQQHHHQQRMQERQQEEQKLDEQQEEQRQEFQKKEKKREDEQEWEEQKGKEQQQECKEQSQEEKQKEKEQVEEQKAQQEQQQQQQQQQQEQQQEEDASVVLPVDMNSAKEEETQSPPAETGEQADSSMADATLVSDTAGHDCEENVVFARFIEPLNAKCGTHGSTPLHVAAENDAAGVVVALLEARAEINLGDDQFDTPAHCAVLYGAPRALERLIEFKADLLSENGTGELPLHVMAEFGPGIDPSEQDVHRHGDPDAWVKRHFNRCIQAQRVLVDALRRNGQLNQALAHQATGDGGNTALHSVAAAGGHYGARCAAQLLIEARAELERLNRRGQTPLALALQMVGDSEVTIVLRQAGASEPAREPSAPLAAASGGGVQ